MARNIFIISLTTIMLASCGSDKVSQKRKNEINKVCFALGGCYGHCPYLAIEIDSSLTYNFYGGQYSDTTGYFTGRVSQSFWDTLNIKFEQINFKQLDTSYEQSVDDASTETIIYFDNQRKHIHAQATSLPDSLLKLLIWMSETYKKVPLRKVVDSSIIFETRIQNLLPPITTPIKFIPPNVK